jgi:hypothetical protein
MVGPGDEIAASAKGHGPLRASQSDREQVISALKAAFVQGLLAKDEFDQRVGQVLATYADLDALTADIPAGLIAAQPPEPVRQSHNKKLIARGAAAGAGASMVLVTAGGVASGHPGIGLAVAGVLGPFVAVLLAALLTFLSWVLDKSSNRQAAQGPPPGASGEASQRLAWADPAGPPSQISHDPPPTAKAAPSRLPDPPVHNLRSPQRWRPLVHRYAIGCPGH